MNANQTSSPTTGSNTNPGPGNAISELMPIVATSAVANRIVITSAMPRCRMKLRWLAPITMPSENSIEVKRLLPLQSNPTIPTPPKSPE